VRTHVLAGRTFDSLQEVNAAFAVWLPIRRAQRHRTHGQIIADRAAVDRAALGPLPELPYVVADHHLRRVGKDCLISFEASLYSVPARRVRAGQRVQVRACADTIAIHALQIDGGGVLAVHARARRRGTQMIDPSHWDGLPDGHTRATVVEPAGDRPGPAGTPCGGHFGEPDDLNPLAALLAGNPAASTLVARRPLADYDRAALPAARDREARR
jgi:hypothetical protein